MGAWANASRNCNPFRAVPLRPVPPAPPTPSRRRAGGPPSGSPSRPDTIAPVHPVAPEPMRLLKPRKLRTRAAVLKPPQNPVRECGPVPSSVPRQGKGTHQFHRYRFGRPKHMPHAEVCPHKATHALSTTNSGASVAPAHPPTDGPLRTEHPLSLLGIVCLLSIPTIGQKPRQLSDQAPHQPGTSAQQIGPHADPNLRTDPITPPRRRPVPGPARWPGPPSGGRSWPRSSPRPANGGPTVTDRGVPSRREHRARPCAVEEVTLGPWKHRMARGKPPLCSAS